MIHSDPFKQKIQQTWESWQHHLDRFSQIDYEETHESLTIILPDGRKYLFNLHNGMAQMWMASPISGGRHFHISCLRSTEKTEPCSIPYWTDTRNQEIIEHILNREFQEHWNLDLGLRPYSDLV